ncbi:B12-binding domain-containing radical SAM protein [Rhodoplanes elegans]|uniref:B12-binding domain-containing radical SAM protein n=1 Tax=Rhodoplanes elegans TaxID=29408 RepID=A0A327K840_9BRAD|nr:B12-binding domain-containing radical SAM protein [Rhodoplanes elegans]MBK5961883.1 B12-binding domain-containing radical SAM protein [Rhodoplanes elegans]RAI33552.1 B12-binding domain-containing radical SAM protein [Rhodoplanes elegans]
MRTVHSISIDRRDTAGPDRGRRILCVCPRYTSSFGMFEHAYPLTDGVRALMPPQGLLVIAAAVPPGWEVRFVDENIRPATHDDFRWADAVFVTGMHAQRRQIEAICHRAHMFDRVTVLGGSSVSACPENYPEYDYLHVGELGDATEALFARLAADPTRPERQIVLTTKERRELTDFPLPAYELAELPRYLTGSIQYSSGCPYNCEFCDIPALYGRNPRLKTPAQVTAELDKLLACGMTGPVYFVDDNFIGNRRAVRELLPTLVDWQKARGYPFIFSCEATLNIAKRPEILSLMREASFETVFCGIETPEPEALEAIAKDHNMMVPLLEAVDTLNRHGLEVVSGIILGLDTDTPDTGARVIDFIERSRIPMLTINLLQALPRTPLWDRLEKEGRLIDEEDRESNVDFRMPYDEVLAMWRDCMERAFSPAAVLSRYRHQLEHTYPNRLKVPFRQRHVPWRDVVRGLKMLRAVLWEVGVKADYRAEFWKVAVECLKRGQIEHLIRIGVMAHHLVMSGRDAVEGRQKASHYSARPQEVPVPAE